MVPADHPLAAREYIWLSEAKNERFLLPPEDSLFRESLEKIFHQAGFEPSIKAEVQHEHRLDLVRCGVGVTIWTESAIRYYGIDDQKCRIIRIKDDFCKRCIFLLWQKEKRKSSGVSEFINYVMQEGKRVHCDL